jgi:diadenosine tetraphosphate (Ap4A) HIT family hydrolase
VRTINECIFCDPENFIYQTKHFNIIQDKFPVNKGHLLIIPKRHIETFFELSEDETLDLRDAITDMKECIDVKYEPDGYNIGINNGFYSGQSIFHLHIHLIPRYKGDVEIGELKGGIRNFKTPLVPY